jgi:hypothetical protein
MSFDFDEDVIRIFFFLSSCSSDAHPGVCDGDILLGCDRDTIMQIILIYIYVLSGRSQDLRQRAILLVTLKLRLMLRRELQRQR